VEAIKDLNRLTGLQEIEQRFADIGKQENRMLRRLGRLVGVAFLTFVTVVPPAWAECAWVLWVTGTDGSSTAAAPWNSYKSLQECKQDQQGPAMKKILSENERKGLHLLPVCLPDTVDPRGPKGSGR
jgi:hypothetical protein